MTRHEPIWPYALCADCGRRYPCDAGLEELVAAKLWDLFDQAAREAPAVPFLALYQQCIRRPLRTAMALAGPVSR
ncbi:hypothetical protein [Actinoplanes palleronii]|uniref:Uncharacterized protein n=1 Tax=Actinoplanes palleronii TaxID=113570 RepID=A0ABQ4BQT5_9ACTN|nr:hypothetical protein [Actinoplanes palleronii]GIE73020.1 hypothetical protein Apa02nite_091280 [Actinoplanes palleronii]